ncbi:MAG: response regulator [Deltaproteobacteria bacterium]|nr:response regulator [Deltaproteobacteria bacterium]
MNKVNDEIFSIPQAAKRCAISRWTLMKCVNSGELKASRTPGGHYRILKQDLEDFIIKKEMYPQVYNHSLNKRILIVDDDLQVQKLLTVMLSSKQYIAETASSGFEAGAKVVKFKPSLIILDLVMPEMSGFEVCRQIKKNPETSYMKIMVLTGHDSKENREGIMEAGADDYLVKPVEKNVLLEHVEHLLSITEEK